MEIKLQDGMFVIYIKEYYKSNKIFNSYNYKNLDCFYYTHPGKRTKVESTGVLIFYKYLIALGIQVL
jgi:hypothetical protein